jgi:hypothetical protein
MSLFFIVDFISRTIMYHIDEEPSSSAAPYAAAADNLDPSTMNDIIFIRSMEKQNF